MDIYVGNLSPSLSAWQLRKAFERFGKVDKVSLSERTHDDSAFGFCFIEMPFANQALRAIAQLHGKMLSGYSLTVKESGVRV